MNADTPLWKAHDIGERLQDKIEALPGVERAFVHVDHETSHAPVRIFVCCPTSQPPLSSLPPMPFAFPSHTLPRLPPRKHAIPRTLAHADLLFTGAPQVPLGTRHRGLSPGADGVRTRRGRECSPADGAGRRVRRGR